MTPVWNLVLSILIVVAILAVMGFGIWFFCFRKRKNKDRVQDGSMEEKAFMNAGAKNHGWSRF